MIDKVPTHYTTIKYVIFCHLTSTSNIIWIKTLNTVEMLYHVHPYFTCIKSMDWAVIYGTTVTVCL